MTIFKKGDRVIRTKGAWRGVSAGNIYTVLESSATILKLEDQPGSYDPEFFALAVYGKKPVTVEVCHQVVALDCELGSLQAQLDNVREAYKSQVADIEFKIGELDAALVSLKNEYDVK